MLSSTCMVECYCAHREIVNDVYRSKKNHTRKRANAINPAKSNTFMMSANKEATESLTLSVVRSLIDLLISVWGIVSAISGESKIFPIILVARRGVEPLFQP